MPEFKSSKIMSVDISKIKISPTENSRLKETDLSNIPFGRVFTDHYFKASYKNGEWQEMEISPIQHFSLHPSNLALHYGQSIFEGMKASSDDEGHPLLFRPEDHARRLNRSAARMCMPDFPEEIFMEAIRKLVDLDRDWIPKSEGSSLYIRPLMFAADEFLGVAPSESYLFVILLLPVGPYYDKPVKLLADTEHIRASVGGTGEAKTAGNYAASLLPSRLAKEKGYDQVLWLDGRERKYVQEVGTMNIFFVFEDHIVTPATDGAILSGITRQSFITLLREKGHRVEERPITIREVMDKGASGELLEVFGSGTAAVATIVSEIRYKDEQVKFDPEEAEIGPMLKQAIEDIRSGKKEDTHQWIVKIN